jgi:hypothetical protein
MAAKRAEFEFNNEQICLVMPKHIDLERMLISFYMLLKYDGRRPVTRTGRQEITLQYLSEALTRQHGDLLSGFVEHNDLVKDWLYSDLIDIVYRGKPDKERPTSPRPLHLNAYKLRNPRYLKDYRASEHLYSMIRSADPELLKRLKHYLGAGMDPHNEEAYDGETELDLDTLLIVHMVDNPKLKEQPAGEMGRLAAPLCEGQARLLCNDLRRLLVYEDRVPRPVLIDYLRMAFGLHLGLYLLRLFNQLSGWVDEGRASPTCRNCPVQPDRQENAFAACPYAFQHQNGASPYRTAEIVVDMGNDAASHMAGLARASCAAHYQRMNDYVRAVFTANLLSSFARSTTGQEIIGKPGMTIIDAFELLGRTSSRMDAHFNIKIDEFFDRRSEGDVELREYDAIRRMEGLTPLKKLVELVTLDRTRYYRKYLIDLVDAVFMKNQDSGLMRQGKGRNNERRWQMGSRLLEMLVQIAVLEPVGSGAALTFRSRPLLIDEFVGWLRKRYGIVLAPEWSGATIQDYEAFNANLGSLKERLREIGFFTDLSDAYNAQTIRPRYTIEAEVMA